MLSVALMDTPYSFSALSAHTPIFMEGAAGVIVYWQLTAGSSMVKPLYWLTNLTGALSV